MPKNGKIIATIECRMTSSRLPGKVLMEAIAGRSMLEVMVERVKRAKQIEEVVLATTINSADDPIATLAKKLGTGCFRGSEGDVLSRVLCAAREFEADIIVELTGDCPLIDPQIISQVIDCYLLNDADYVSNCAVHSYPVGMDTQVFSRELLERANLEGLTPDDREHVSWYFVRNPEKFRLFTVAAPPALKFPDIAVTLDEKEDCELIRRILERLYYADHHFNCQDIVELIKKEPGLMRINEHIKRRQPVK